MKKEIKRANKNTRLLIIAVSLLVVVILAFVVAGLKNNKGLQGAAILNSKISLAELEKDVYPQFVCSCCGNTIDKCTCGMAKEMKEYLSSLAEEGISKDEIIIAGAKKYGITSLASTSLQEKVKEDIIKNAPKENPKIVIEPSYYNFGDISQAKGIISTIFNIKNEGESDLIINNMESSCMCTTASIIYDGAEGPRFGMSMHGSNPKEWSVSIPPGEEAQLKVYYDPDAHGKFTGLVTRTIDIYSNDPIDFQKQVRIELNQIP